MQMQSVWLCRAFFVVIAAIAVAGLLSGTACTRYGKPGPIPPTLTPLSAIYVNAKTGSDTSGNGSQNSPFKSLTKAVAVLAAAKSLSLTGVTIYVASGDYDVANGEKFPIVVPTAVTITGSNYGFGARSGTFINGYGQDTGLASLIHVPARSAFTTLEAAASADVTLSNLYVGASKLSLPGARAAYASFDAIGSLTAATSSFGAGIVSAIPNTGGVLVAGGSFTCSSCAIHGNDYGVGGFAVTVVPPSPPSSPSPSASPPSATPSPSPPVIVGPTITLSRSTGPSTIAARAADILTDGSVNITVSGESFQQAEYAYSDARAAVIRGASRGAIDFGGGVANSSGGNLFVGARSSEISIVHPDETISALGDYWNPSQQRASSSGLYLRNITFGSGAHGRNVTIAGDASGSTVTVGPAQVPTPTPTVSPSSSPTSSPT
jgi:Protein of unknown function (DUF1565)